LCFLWKRTSIRKNGRRRRRRRKKRRKRRKRREGGHSCRRRGVQPGTVMYLDFEIQ